MKKKIIRFWKCSIENNMDKFDFEDFLSEFQALLLDKLSGHGQISFEDYLKLVGKKYYNLKILKQFAYKSEHTGYTESYEDILKAVFYKRYKMFNKNFSKSELYNKMKEVYRELCNRKDLTRSGLVFLTDKCIHLEHNSGFICNIDISKLRKELK